MQVNLVRGKVKGGAHSAACGLVHPKHQGHQQARTYSEARVTPRPAAHIVGDGPPAESPTVSQNTISVERGWRPPGRRRWWFLMPPPVPPGAGTDETSQGHHQQHPCFRIAAAERAARCWKPAGPGPTRHGSDPPLKISCHHGNEAGALLPVTMFVRARPRAPKTPARRTSAAPGGWWQCRSCGCASP